MKRYGVVLAFVSAVLSFTSCDHAKNSLLNPEPPFNTIRSLSVAEKQLIQADNTFTFKLLSAINEEDPDKNIFISPLSISMALGMTLNGAGGDTKEAMKTALELQGMSQDDINNSYQSLIALLTTLDPDVAMRIANSIWIRDGFSVEQDFIDVNQTYFDAEVSNLDFSDPTAADIINDWVNDATEEKIPDIVTPPIDPQIVLILINAVYFNGNWTYPFDPEITDDDPFYLPDGSTKNTPFMMRSGQVNAFENEDILALDIPYGTYNFCMTILMPAGAESIDEFISHLDMSGWNQWLNSFTWQEDCILKMPKFKYEYEIKLNDVLSALGMEIAFTGAADFSYINEQETLWIDEVKHKTFVDVNEEGTEAAAATSVLIALGPGGPPRYTVNRPFLFFIRERATGSILFAGKMLDPEY
ncbi:serpin family protein [candidate division KSB1 bacterium]